MPSTLPKRKIKRQEKARVWGKLNLATRRRLWYIWIQNKEKVCLRWSGVKGVEMMLRIALLLLVRLLLVVALETGKAERVWVKLERGTLRLPLCFAQVQVRQSLGGKGCHWGKCIQFCVMFSKKHCLRGWGQGGGRSKGNLGTKALNTGQMKACAGKGICGRYTRRLCGRRQVLLRCGER